MALPLLFRRPHIAPLDGTSSSYSPPLEPATRFLFDPRNDWRLILFSGRLMNVVAALALGFFVWLWSRELFGVIGAAVSLGLYCLSPTIVGNSSLATVDIFTSLWFLVSCRAWWSMLTKVTISSVVFAGVSAGFLAATKISAVLLCPMLIVMIGLRLYVAGAPEVEIPLITHRPDFKRSLVLTISILASLALAVLTLWVCYIPQLIIFPGPAGSALTFSHLAHAYSGGLSECLNFLSRVGFLPEPWLHDLRVFFATTSLRRAYLLGEYSLGGWWYFFPVAWFLKAPIPFLLALFGAFAGLSWKRIGAPLLGIRMSADPDGGGEAIPSLKEFIPLVVLVGVYFSASMASGLNIGLRHLLPVFPPLFILSGALVCLPLRRFACLMFAGVLLLWSAKDLWSVRGEYLSYFNSFAGGPAQGHRYLVDSSVVWGQDLPAFESWLERKQNRGEMKTVYLSYFGNADLRRFRIGATKLLPQFYDLRPASIDLLEAGSYVISATMLRSVYGPLFGPWRPSYENLYQRLRSEHSLAAELLSRPNGTLTLTADQIHRLRVFEWLRFNRLCAYLRLREPDSRISNGLLVYDLSASELAVALTGPPRELAAADAVVGAAKLSQEKLDFIK